MTDKNFVIELDDDTEGHGLPQGIVEPDDSQWLEEKLRTDSGKRSFRISVLDEDDDTEGHAFRGGPVVRVSLGDEDDTEGHAIAIHFPSRTEADAFRRRLMVTGVLVGTVALGAASGVGLSALQSDSDSAGASGASTISQVGPLDAHEAPAFGINTPAQVGPLDAHEAPAFQQSAPAVDVNRDVGIMDGSGAAAATQVGPLDAHEAPAFQQSTQVGPLDAHEAPAFQSGDTADAGSSELNDIGGPTPR
ncbi:MAG: hypothetical protein M3153_09390 [Chloroflexota bacterium]|nr:hypothetical protein [Chloroflexota bacterium]